MNKNCSYDSQSNYICNYQENFENKKKIYEHHTIRRNIENQKLKVPLPDVKAMITKYCGPFESDCQIQCGDTIIDEVKALGEEGRDYIWKKGLFNFGGEGKCLNMIVKEPEKLYGDDIKKKSCGPFESSCKDKCGNRFVSKSGEKEYKIKK